MKKHILFTSIDGMTDPLGQSQVLPYLIGLMAKGYTISIVSCEKERNFRKNQDIINRLIVKYNIAWSYCFYKTKIPIISQLQNFLSLKRLTIKEASLNKNIILHCRSYLPALIGLQLKRKYKTKYIFDMRGLWADERLDGSIWRLNNPIHNLLYKYFKRKEVEMLENADYIVTLTDNAKEEIKSWKLKTESKIEVIPCCTDINHFMISDDKKVTEYRNDLGLSRNNYVVGYLGSLGTWYMLEEMLELFAELQKKKPDSIFFFITNDDKEWILSIAESKGISSQNIIIKSAKREEVPSYISCMDIGLFFIKSLYSKKGSSPTKLAELLACGIPIITNKGVGDVDRLIVQTNCGVLVSSFDKTGYDEAINKLQTLNPSKQYYRDISSANFSLERGIESYDKIYNYLSTDK